MARFDREFGIPAASITLGHFLRYMVCPEPSNCLVVYYPLSQFRTFSFVPGANRRTIVCCPAVRLYNIQSTAKVPWINSLVWPDTAPSWHIRCIRHLVSLAWRPRRVMLVSTFILDMFGDRTEEGTYKRWKAAHSEDPLRLVV